MDSFQKLQLQPFCKHGSLLGLETPPCPNSTFTTLHPLEEILQCFLPLGVTFCGIESLSKPVLACLKTKSEGMIFRRRKLSFVIPENLSHCYPLPVTTLGAQSGNCVPVGRGSGKYLGIVQERSSPQTLLAVPAADGNGACVVRGYGKGEERKCWRGWRGWRGWKCSVVPG